MRARHMPFMPPALFPCLLQAVPPSPRKSNNSDNDRDLRYLQFLNKGSQLKELAELLTKAGTNCPSPALDAEGGRTGSGDNLVCRMRRDWHTYINYGGNTLVMDGKINIQDLTR
jgi:hypothetical protein